MHLIGLIRLGKNAEVRYTPSGEPVCNFSGAWNYGRKADDDKRPTQWIELAMWGERGEKMSEYLLKGKQFSVVVDDVHVETYERRDGGSGAKLLGRVVSIEFTDGKQDGQQAAPAPSAGRASPPMPARSAAASSSYGATRGEQKTGTAFDDMDSDIPFASLHAEHDPLFVDRKSQRARRTR
jgi:single-strand DNA-binding protein